MGGMTPLMCVPGNDKQLNASLIELYKNLADLPGGLLSYDSHFLQNFIKEGLQTNLNI